MAGRRPGRSIRRRSGDRTSGECPPARAPKRAVRRGSPQALHPEFRVTMVQVWGSNVDALLSVPAHIPACRLSQVREKRVHAGLIPGAVENVFDLICLFLYCIITPDRDRAEL